MLKKDVTAKPNSILSLILSILNNTQFLVTFLTLISVLYLHSIHSIYFSIGTLISAFSAKLLKKCIRQPRPIGAKKYTKTYGMPSTHSSSISFFGTYLSLSTLLLPIHPKLITLLPFWKYFNTGSSSARLGEIVTRSIIAGGWIIGAGLVCWSRIKLNHHTFKQVLVGALLGSLVAVVWLSLWLGLEDITTRLRLDTSFRDIIIGNERIPQVLREGLQELGKVWGVVIEDTFWFFLETWKAEGTLKAVKGLKDLPLLIIRGKDEL